MLDPSFLQDVNTSILPRADNAYDLGSSDKRWRDLYVAGFGDLGSLRIGGVEVIDSDRNLKNVSIPIPADLIKRMILITIAFGGG